MHFLTSIYKYKHTRKDKIMKKIFFVSISMLPDNKLIPVNYAFEGKDTYTDYKTCFPSIPMIENNISSTDEVKIVAVKTDDDNELSRKNYALFLEELNSLCQRTGIDLSVNETVTVPHNENKSKLIALLKSLCKIFESDSEVYMDVTFGTKVTSIELFTSLVYAAKVKGCNIRSVVYGKYNHADNNTKGTIYDIRCLYDIANLIYAADHLPENKIDDLLDQLWG